MDLRNIPGGIVLSVAIGVVDSLIVWAIATLFDVSVKVRDGLGSDALADLALWHIVLVVAVASVAAGILLWILQRVFTPERALQIFQIIATIVLVVSLAIPITTDQDLAAKLALAAMQILVGSAIIATMTWVGTKPTVPL